MRPARFPQRHRGHLTDTYRELLEGLLFLGGLDFKDPPPFSPLPPHREQEETIAHHLYEVLRDFDSCNVSAIYSEAFFTPKMGQAIMNRLLKAAGHKIINVQEEEENDSTGM